MSKIADARKITRTKITTSTVFQKQDTSSQTSDTGGKLKVVYDKVVPGGTYRSKKWTGNNMHIQPPGQGSKSAK